MTLTMKIDSLVPESITGLFDYREKKIQEEEEKGKNNKIIKIDKIKNTFTNKHH